MGYEQLRNEIHQLIGFKEPMNLISIRLTWLEREKKIDQALNLSLALGLFENAAKFQIKLNDVQGACATAEKIRDSNSLYSVAQVARPVDPRLAFRLILNSIVSTYLEALESKKNSLSARENEIIMWAVGLAESEGLSEELLTRLIQEIHSKVFLMAIFTLLNEKGKSSLALELGEKMLPTYTLDELQTIFKDLRSKIRWIREKWEGMESRMMEDEKTTFFKHRSSLLSLLPFCQAVDALPSQMYKIASNALTNLSKLENPSIRDEETLKKQQNLNESIRKIIDASLLYSEDVQALLPLLQGLSVDRRYDDVFRVGYHVLNLTKKYQEAEQVYQEKRTRDKFEFDELRQKEMQERSLVGTNATMVFVEPIRDHPNFKFSQTFADVFKIVLETAILSMNRYRPTKTLRMGGGGGEGSTVGGKGTTLEFCDVEETEEDRIQREKLLTQAQTLVHDIAIKVFDYLESIESVLKLAAILKSDCLKISLEMLRGCFEVLKRSRIFGKENEEVRDKAKLVEMEIQRLVQEKQKPSVEQLQQLKELRLAVALQSILPPQRNSSQEFYDSSFFSVGQTMISFAMSSFDSQNRPGLSSSSTTTAETPLSQDEIKRLFDLCLEHIHSPQHLTEIAKTSLAGKEDPVYTIYFVDQIIPKVKSLYNKWMMLAMLETERDILVEEQSELQYKFKKDLDEPQLNRLSELNQKIQQFENGTGTTGGETEKVVVEENSSSLPYYCLGKNASYFHNMQLQLLKLKLLSVFHRRNMIIQTYEKPEIDRTTEQEQKLAQEITNSWNMLQSVFRTCLDQITLSIHYTELTQFYVSHSDLTLKTYVSYAENDLGLLLELFQRIVQELPEEIEIERIEFAKIDLKGLRDEVQVLWDEVQNRQMISEEQQQQIRILELETRLFIQKYSGCDIPTFGRISSIRKHVFRQVISLITSVISTFHNCYRSEFQSLEDLLVQAATQNTPTLFARKNEKLLLYQKWSEQSSLLLERAVDMTLSKVSGPSTLMVAIDQIHQHLEDCNRPLSSSSSSSLHDNSGCGVNLCEFATTQLFKLALHLRKVLDNISIIRIERQKTYEDVENFEREQKEYAQLRKPFPKESVELLKKYRRQILQWKSGLSSLNLKEDEIRKYAIDCSISITRSVAERKFSLEKAVANWKSQLVLNTTKMSDEGPETLSDYYQRRAQEDSTHLSQIEQHWATLGTLFFDWIQSPSQVVKLMEVLKSDTDLVIRFAQRNFVMLENAQKRYDERKPLYDEYTTLTMEKNELLQANKTLRPEELVRWSELNHMIYEWEREFSDLRLTPKQILSFNKLNSELVLRALFANISQLSDSVRQLSLLIQASSEDGNTSIPVDTSSISIEYKALSPSEREECLRVTQQKLDRVVKVLHEQIEACFPYMNEPAHLINTAKMCKKAGQLDCVMKVCLHAVQIISQLEEKREEIASIFRRFYLRELEKYFATEFRFTFAGASKEEFQQLQKETEELAAQDLSGYQVPLSSTSNSRKSSSSSSKRAHNNNNSSYSTTDFTYIPITQSNISSLNSGFQQKNYLKNFYSYLDTVSNSRELTPDILHFRIGRYSTLSTDAENFPIDQAAPFVHSDFLKSLFEIFSLMISSVIEKRYILKKSMEEKVKFGGGQMSTMMMNQDSNDEDQLDKFNSEILSIFEKACVCLEGDLNLINTLMHQILSFDLNQNNSREKLHGSEFNLSLPILEMFLKKVTEREKEIRSYEDNFIAYIKILSEEATLNQQRKELEPDQFQKLRELRSTFAELFTFVPGLRLSVDSYRSHSFQNLKTMLQHLLLFKSEKNRELEGMVRQPRLARGRSMSEEEIKKEFEENEKEQTELNDKVIQFVLQYIQDPIHLTYFTHSLFDEKEMGNVIQIAGKAQDILKLRLANRLRFEGIIKQVTERLRGQLVVVKDSPASSDVQDLLYELEALQLLLWEDVGNQPPRVMILSLADNMIDAARAENRMDVVEAQSILVFKMRMTIEKFEEVHTLVGAEKWEKEVRHDLLSYVHSYDPTLPGSPIKLLQQIEILISEGWWKQALEHRPEPSVEDASQSIDVLKLLWFAVEKHSPPDLDILVKTIDAFAIKEFQKFNLNSMDSLLDVVQTRFPERIFDLYKRGSDIFITNSSTKKYKIYVDFLIVMKTRLLAMGLVKEWNEYIAQVRKREIRKKVLINLLNVNDL
jgi:hypothetical protein